MGARERRSRGAAEREGKGVGELSSTGVCELGSERSEETGSVPTPFLSFSRAHRRPCSHAQLPPLRRRIFLAREMQLKGNA